VRSLFGSFVRCAPLARSNDRDTERNRMVELLRRHDPTPISDLGGIVPPAVRNCDCHGGETPCVFGVARVRARRAARFSSRGLSDWEDAPNASIRRATRTFHSPRIRRTSCAASRPAGVEC